MNIGLYQTKMRNDLYFPQAPECVLPVRAGVSRPPRGLARPPEVAARPRGVRDGVAHQQPALRRAVAEAVEAALPGLGVRHVGHRGLGAGTVLILYFMYCNICTELPRSRHGTVM